MCVAAHLSDQLLNMRRESEVMAGSWENLTCLGRPVRPGHFFSKTDSVTNVGGQVSDTRWESKGLAVACESSICQAEGRIMLSFFQKWVWRQKFSPKPSTQDGKVRSLPGAGTNEPVQTSCGAGARFFKMCVAANLSVQLLNMRRESEVMARSWENLTCLGRPRHPGHFFPKRIR